MNTTDTSGRGWAYTGAILGGLVSVAANVAHSYIPPANAPTTWTPEPGAVVGAIVWPVFLFIAVEILARVRWPQGFWWAAMRFGGMLPVAAVAAFVSYRHLSGLLAHYGEEAIVYRLGPLAVDGLMVMATGGLLAIGARTRTTTATTVAAAETTTTTPTPIPAPAVVVPDAAAAAPVEVRPAPALPVPPARSPVASESESAISTQAPARLVPVAPTSAPAPPTPDTPVAPVSRAQPVTPVPAAILTRARHLADAHHATQGTPITPGELAVRLRVDTNTAGQLLTAINDTTVGRVNGYPVGAR